MSTRSSQKSHFLVILIIAGFSFAKFLYNMGENTLARTCHLRPVSGWARNTKQSGISEWYINESLLRAGLNEYADTECVEWQ